MLMVTTKVMGTVRDHQKAAKAISSAKSCETKPKGSRRSKPRHSNASPTKWTLKPIRTAFLKLLSNQRVMLTYPTRAPTYSLKDL